MTQKAKTAVPASGPSGRPPCWAGSHWAVSWPPLSWRWLWCCWWWLAALIVAVVVAIAAGIAALVGKRKVAEAGPPVPTDTVESVKKDVEEIKESARR